MAAEGIRSETVALEGAEHGAAEGAGAGERETASRQVLEGTVVARSA